jgi:hypothetical protein
VAIESQIRAAVRDAVNRESRKPFFWGGLKGFQQLDAIAKVLHGKASPAPPGKASPVPSGMVGTSVETAYFQQLIKQVDRALAQNRELANGLQEAHTWLRKIAACLRYPPRSYPDFDDVTSQQVSQEMDALLKELQQQAQAGHQVLKTLYAAVDYRWKLYGQDLLPCYDMPGLPPDNLQLESLFNRLRSHQRRISGRKSTKELRDFGQYQVLFMAETESALLEQLRCVPISEYLKHRQQLAQAEVPRLFFHRLHRDPSLTIQKLLDRYSQRQVEFTNNASSPTLNHTV